MKHLVIQEIWIEQAIEGDLTAFGKIYECIYKEMYRYAYFMLGDVHDAEDVVSETVMDMYTGLKKLKKKDSFKSWAFTILTNKCRKMRKTYTQKQLSLEDENVNQELIGKEKDFALCMDMEKAMQVLKAEEKAVVLLSVISGYTSEEVGKILKLKPGTVRSKLQRSLEKMRKKLSVSYG